ncbi:potassium/proton antiporter [Bacteroidales bacterium OttesenSCG-928-C19]|nr:potassium/proton antiporter [Bacteroidales bacterium OttesenSCG-928-C19]
MVLSIETALLGVSLLFFLSIFVSKAGYRFGVPTLLLFLGVGMIFGSDGFGIRFENIDAAQRIGTIALCIILFSGGMDTKISEIKPVMAQGIILATVGVLFTAILTGLLTYWVFGWMFPSIGIGLLTALLLASTMSSTDSASVFSILRSKGLHLKNNLRPMLELESGSNDPVAYILTITLIGLVNAEAAPNYWMVGVALLLQLIIGAAAGFILGKFSVFMINKLKLDNSSLYPILVFTVCIFIFSATYFLKGNSYLAVYIGGLVIGNSRFVHKRSSLKFFDGLAWMCQLFMFLTLGLLVNPSELVPLIIPGLVISFIMIFLSRPISVFLCLLPFRKMPRKDKTFISWVGLRGAVPIIFAIITLAENVPHAQLIFNLVFICTLVSLIVQGTSLPKVAMWLGLAEQPNELKKADEFDIEMADDIKSVTTEIEVTAEALEHGSLLMDMPLPDQTLVVLIKRNDKYFVPTGKTPIHEHDKLLIITDNQEALMQTIENMKVRNGDE